MKTLNPDKENHSSRTVRRNVDDIVTHQEILEKDFTKDEENIVYDTRSDRKK